MNQPGFNMTTQHVIVNDSYGDIRLYQATLDNALRIFVDAEDNIPKEITDLADSIAQSDNKLVFVSSKVIGKALHDCLIGQTGRLRALWYGKASREAVSGKLDADTRPELPISEVDVDSLKLFLFDNKITDVTYSCGTAHNILKLNVLKLPCLKPFMDRINNAPVCLLDDEDDMDDAVTYNRIRSDDWKSDSTIAEVTKVRRIISFVCKYSNRNEKYVVVPVTPTY